MSFCFFYSFNKRHIIQMFLFFLVFPLFTFFSSFTFEDLVLKQKVYISFSNVHAEERLPTQVISVTDKAEMVLVPGGQFIFGMDQQEMKKIVTGILKEKIVEFYLSEFSKQQKTLKAFYIDRYEVTNKLYTRFLNETKHRKPKYWDYPQFNSQQQPVVGVGWADAEAYCRWANKRLPTEEEWEKAARGEDGRIWPWGNKPDDTKYNGRKKGFYAPVNVGSFPTGNSSYGASDMAGNVWEMTSSNWKGKSKTMKGGSFLNTNADVRVAVRWAAADENDGANWLGFRCVMDIEQYYKEQKVK